MGTFVKQGMAAWKAALLLFVGLLGALWVFGQLRRAWKDASELRELSGPRPPTTISVEPSEDPAKRQAEAQMDAAARMWRAYEKLPTSQRTKEAWLAAVTESRTHGEGLRPPFDKLFAEANEGLVRKYGAPLISPEAIAAGEFFRVLVPSSEHAKCIIWANMWSKGETAESLRSLGFTGIRCDGTSYMSKLTGEIVKEPSRYWPVGR